MNLLTKVRRQMFGAIHSSQLIYNTCWEDPRLDREALKLTPADSILMITSAGCNALDYALCSPRRIFSVDMNPRQNALLELKIAGIRSLEFEDFYELFGTGSSRRFPALYRSAMRPQLSDESKRFWDRQQDLFDPATRRQSFYYRGTTGLFAWLFTGYLNRVLKAYDAIESLLGARSVDEQRRIYQSELQPQLFSRWIRWFVRRDTTMALLGVPRAQRDQLDRDFSGGVAKFIEDCVEAVFTRLPLRDNYFWRVYLTGQYAPECCPEYLKPANFARLRSGLVDSIRICTATIADFLRSTTEKISRFVLLDHMDWLSANDIDSLRDEWNEILHSANDGARFLWRSAGIRSDFVDNLHVDAGYGSRRLGDMLRYDRDTADRLHAVDRVHTYGSFHIADWMP